MDGWVERGKRDGDAREGWAAAVMMAVAAGFGLEGRRWGRPVVLEVSSFSGLVFELPFSKVSLFIFFICHIYRLYTYYIIYIKNIK